MLSLKKVGGLISNVRLTVVRQISLSSRRQIESDDYKNSNSLNNQAEMDEIPSTPSSGVEKSTYYP